MHSDFLDSLLYQEEESCRNLNFEAPAWEGLERLLAELGQSFRTMEALDQDGRKILFPFRSETWDSIRYSKRCVITEFSDGTGLLDNIEVYVIAESDGSPFVEISFWADDIEQTESLQQDFMEWADNLKTIVQARRCFLRHENTSWKFGDAGAGSGVFWVSA